MERSYYGYRIDVQNAEFFNNELKEGNLRQGWGYEECQKLPDTTDIGAKSNLPIYKKVKKGDILLIPRLPSWDDVTIVEATEDFETGYKFERNKELGDYGHIFPVKLITHFNRYCKNSYGILRGTLSNPRRFWQINCGESVEEIIKSGGDKEGITPDERLRISLTDAFEKSFDNKKFKEAIIENAKKHLRNEDWEYALVKALSIKYPNFDITRVSGPKEKRHGTDILIKISGLKGIEYGIAIQVKDWWGEATEWAIDQLNKADGYWYEVEGIKLIDKILIITKASYNENENFKLLCIKNGIITLFTEDLSELLYEVGKMALLKQ